MSKRLFRRTLDQGTPSPTYPTLEEFDHNRRSFLQQLGAVILGSSVISAVLMGCDGDNNEDDKPPSRDTGGVAPDMPSRLDSRPPVRDSGGVAPDMPARLDVHDDGAATAPPKPNLNKRVPDLGQPDS